MTFSTEANRRSGAAITTVPSMTSADASAARIGAAEHGDFLRLSVWAPNAQTLEVEILGATPRRVPLERDDDQTFRTTLLREEVVGKNYWLWLDGHQRRADPASRHQPEGVHGPSQFVDTQFEWTDAAWRGLPLDQYVLYELHVGCFSRAGDFSGVENQLDQLSELGVTAIELMPVAQFPGRRNWGYDGVFPFAVPNSYGGPA